MPNTLRQGLEVEMARLPFVGRSYEYRLTRETRHPTEESHPHQNPMADKEYKCLLFLGRVGVAASP